MDDPLNLTLFRDYEIGARVIPCHRRTTASQNSDQPQAHRLRPLLTVGHVAGALPLSRQIGVEAKVAVGAFDAAPRSTSAV
jgi:hypothetical protein